MQNIATLARRELSAFFFSPIAYVVIAVFLAVTGIFFVRENFVPGGEASLRITFGLYMPLILVFVLPILTMRLISEEYRNGTIETLMTAPVSDVDVVLGKFCGAFLFYLAMLATTVLHVVLIATHGNLDFGLLLATYLGLALLGGLYIATGLFFSACTRNQIIAVLCSLVLLAIFTFLTNYVSDRWEGILRVTMQHLSIQSHYENFARGLVDTNDLVFFLSTTIMFLFLSVKVLESRRWR
jgi:ABC-2 type transport system permease protein